MATTATRETTASTAAEWEKGVCTWSRPLGPLELRLERASYGTRATFVVRGGAYASEGSLGTGGTQGFSSDRAYALDELRAGPAISMESR